MRVYDAGWYSRYSKATRQSGSGSGQLSRLRGQRSILAQGREASVIVAACERAASGLVRREGRRQ